MGPDFPPSPSLSNRSASCSGASSPVVGYRDLATRLHERIQSGDPFFSLEFFPPRTPNGAANLIDKIERMASGHPLFCDVTWHPGAAVNLSPRAGSKKVTRSCVQVPALESEENEIQMEKRRGDDGSGSDCTVKGDEISCSDERRENKTPGSIDMAAAMLNQCGIETLLHLTCCNLSQNEINEHLKRARDSGIKNIMALRGDPPAGQEWEKLEDGFGYASDLVRYTRAEFGDFFVIVVAGYPCGHPESPSRHQDLLKLKEKVDAGADFIITQLFFDSENFVRYVRDCQAVGITCPIIPGIMPIQSYRSLLRLSQLSKIEIPESVLKALEPIKDNDESVTQYGITMATDMCRELLSSGLAPGLHFYTLNREKACMTILESLGLITANLPRSLPWKKTANYSRAAEEVRPIFWALRPKSYVTRTSDWDEFPNGRWGNSSAPAFGDVMDHHFFFLKGRSSREEKLDMWGHSPETEQDIWNVFHSHISGEANSHGHTVTHLPWHDGQLDRETLRLISQLSVLNKRGYLTINSQPRVNGIPSDDPDIGWGYRGGYVYQKAYLEFFVSPDRAAVLLQVLTEKYNGRVNYHIINHKGDSKTNSDSLQPIAVTWGVFPGKEIIQPTVVDPISFKIWKDEAFGIWTEHWGRLYPEDSPSRQLLERIQSEYCLVNLVDNDFPQESVLWEVMEEVTRRYEKVKGHHQEVTGQGKNVSYQGQNVTDNAENTAGQGQVSSGVASTKGSRSQLSGGGDNPLITRDSDSKKEGRNNSGECIYYPPSLVAEYTKGSLSNDLKESDLKEFNLKESGLKESELKDSAVGGREAVAGEVKERDQGLHVAVSAGGKRQRQPTVAGDQAKCVKVDPTDGGGC